MNRTVWLSKKQDLDLIALASLQEFNLGFWMRECLRAAARNVKIRVEIPDSMPEETVWIDNSPVTFYLSEKSDADVIRYLESIRVGYQNAAIKAIFRSMLSNSYLFPFFDNSPFVPRTVKIQKGHKQKRRRAYPQKITEAVYRNPGQIPAGYSSISLKKDVRSAPMERKPEGKKSSQPIQKTKPDESKKKDGIDVLTGPGKQAPVERKNTNASKVSKTIKDSLPPQHRAKGTDSLSVNEEDEDFDLSAAVGEMMGEI